MLKIIFTIFFSSLISLIFILSFPLPVSASSVGTVDATYKYAWGENIGWINFGCSTCNVQITDSAITGYAWSENYGWINLNPATSGVLNDSNGNLSGFAWAEGLGWINFSGVIINNSGEFLGYATILIDNSKISFNCLNTNSCSYSDFKVKTNWRPQGTRPACNNALDDDGDNKIDYPSDPGCSSLNDIDETDPGGGGMPPEWHNPPTPPAGGFSVLINNNAESTNILTVTLNLRGGPNTERMAISNFPDFRDAGQEKYVQDKTWNLCVGLASCPEGEYTVYAKFYTPWGRSSEVVSDKIIYKKAVVPIKEKITPPPPPPSVLTPTCLPYLTKYIRYGVANDPNEVKKLQTFLNTYEGEKLKVTGIYDKESFEAVKRFQIKYAKDILAPWGLKTPTGYVWSTTLKKINEIYCQKKPSEIVKRCPIFILNLKLGSRDEEVKKVQQFLIDQGFLPKDFKVSSFFDGTTEKAVKQFQIKYSKEILEPWGLTLPTGYWYINTKKQANKLLGCE